MLDSGDSPGEDRGVQRFQSHAIQRAERSRWNIGSTTFGNVINAAPSRILQAAMKFTF
jgi:hypothetical protein